MTFYSPIGKLKETDNIEHTWKDDVGDFDWFCLTVASKLEWKDKSNSWKNHQWKKEELVISSIVLFPAQF